MRTVRTGAWGAYGAVHLLFAPANLALLYALLAVLHRKRLYLTV